MRLEPTDEHKLGLIPLVVSARPPVRRRPGFGHAAADGFRPKPTPGDARRSADQLTVAAITRSGGGAAGTCRQREGRFALIIGDGAIAEAREIARAPRSRRWQGSQRNSGRLMGEPV